VTEAVIENISSYQ